MEHEWVPIVRGYEIKKLIINYLETEGIVKKGVAYDGDIQFLDRLHRNITDYVDVLIDGDLIFERK